MIELMNGNCLELMQKLPDNSVDLIVTDCPYKIVSGGCRKVDKGGGILNHRYKDNKRKDWTDDARSGKLFKHNDITFSDWLPDVFRLLKGGSHAYIMINARNLKELQTCCEHVGFKFQNLLIWDKGNVTPNRYYMQGFECVLMLRKGKAKTINNVGTSNILKIPNIIGNKKHPTEKPVELMEVLIGNSSEMGDVVLDPFMGSGSTGVTCVNTSRNFIGMELDKEYFDVAEKRINDCVEEWERFFEQGLNLG